MENQQGRVIDFQKFTWKIQDLSKRKTKEQRSESFKVGDVRWRIVEHQIGKGGEQYLYLILKVADTLLPSYRWRTFAHIKLALINQKDSLLSIVKETRKKFNAGYKAWGSSFVRLSDFYDTTKGYLVNNACIIEAQVSVSDVPFEIEDNLTTQSITQTHEFKGGQSEMQEPVRLQDQGIDSSDDASSFTSHDSLWNQASQTELELLQQEDEGIIGPSDETPNPKQVHYVPTAPPLYPSIYDEPEELKPLTPLRKMIDFKSLGPEEVAFVPLLEEVCSWHPSLIESQRKRSPKFSHWAFMALGQVLYFLDTMKVKDMREEAAHNQLQNLWEELQYFKFDLTWLEPHVESALGMKAYMEREEQVRKLKDEVAALEIETKKLRRYLAVAEVDLNIEKRHLAEEEKGFEERNMDAQLGYGIF